MRVDPVRETVRRSRPEDIPALQALFKEAFGQERSAEGWAWKFFENPRGNAGFVCEAGGRIVAHCAGIPLKLRNGGRSATAYALVDFMSSASYAGGVGGGGVFVRTVRRFFSETCTGTQVPLLFGFPSERHRLLGERLLAYKPVELVHDIRLEPTGSGGRLEPLAPSHLSLFSRAPFENGVERDETYLQWRYLEHPQFRYHAVIVRGLFGRARLGALVRESDEGVVHLMELGGDFSDGNVARLTEELSKLGRPVIGWGSPENAVWKRFLDAGFVASPRDHYLCAAWIRATPADAPNRSGGIRLHYDRPAPLPGKIYFTLGDYDVH